MTAPANQIASAKAFWTVVTVALIVIVTFRFLRLLPNWIGGVPPAYAGQYEGRMLFAITIASTGVATLLAVSGRTRSRGGRLAYGVLLVVAVVALAVQMMTGL